MGCVLIVTAILVESAGLELLKVILVFIDLLKSVIVIIKSESQKI